MKTTDPTGINVNEVAKIVALTWVWPKTGVVTLIVVVVVAVSPAPPLNCTVCTWLVFRPLSAMLAVPVIAAAVVGAKSIAKEQLVPEARAGWLRPRAELGASAATVHCEAGRDAGILAGGWYREGKRLVADICHRYCLSTIRAYLRTCKIERARRNIYRAHTVPSSRPRDVQVAGAIESQIIRTQLCVSGRTAVPIGTWRASPSHGGDDACGVDHADDVVVRICDIHVACTIDRYACPGGSFPRWSPVHYPRYSRQCRCPQSVVMTPLRCRDLADAIIVEVRDVDIARAIHCHRSGVVQFRGRSRPIISAKARSAVARNRGDDAASRCDLADAIVAAIRDVEIAGTVHCHTPRGCSVPHPRPVHYPRCNHHFRRKHRR